MSEHLPINFLREKIADLKTALLYSNSKSVLKLPTTIVTAINVDELGHIWLLVPRPPQEVKEFEQHFPVRLDFYRKGKDFHLNISGKASIVLEPGELDEMTENMDINAQHLASEWILVKVIIGDATYHPHSLHAKSSLLSGISAQLNRWLSHDTSRYNPFAMQ